MAQDAEAFWIAAPADGSAGGSRSNAGSAAVSRVASSRALHAEEADVAPLGMLP